MTGLVKSNLTDTRYKTELEATNALFYLSIEADKFDQFMSTKLNTEVPKYAGRIEKLTTKKNDIVANIDNVFRANVQKYIDHVAQKIETINSKYFVSNSLTAQMHTAPSFNALQTTNSNPAAFAQQPQAPINLSVPQIPLNITTAPKNVSFAIINSSQLPEAPKQPLTITLSRISYFLRHNQEAQAFAEFNTLSDDMKGAIFGALWMIRGKPGEGHPLHHPDFGTVSFFNQGEKYASTPQQKASAVELIKTQHSINEIISLLKADRFEEAVKIFEKLPSQIQGKIFETHWIVCDRPTGKHPMAHPDFGKVSFLGLEKRCAVPCAKKAETLEVYLPQFVKNTEVAQEWIAGTFQNFTSIDSMPIAGKNKTIKKNECIHAFAAQIITLFLGQEHEIKIPTLDNSTRPELMAEAYIKEYRFLKPFLMQIAKEMFFHEEKLEVQDASHLPKISSAQSPNLSAMSDAGRRLYRIGIMNETQETLTQGFYINSKGEKALLNFESAFASICSYSANAPDPSKPAPFAADFSPKLVLSKKDCLSVAGNCALRGLKPILLDAASDDHFGGGYKTGAGAQEEYLCRASGISHVVVPFEKEAYSISKTSGDAAGLYVNHVPVFRGEEGQGYPYLDTPFETAFAIMPAYNFNTKLPNPHQLEENRIPNHLVEATKAKIRTVLAMAETRGHDAVVLTALGCGAFQTPPSHMAQLILEVILKDFRGSFKEIHFSILDDHNTGLPHNLKGNYAEFKATIEWNIEELMKYNIIYRESP